MMLIRSCIISRSGLRSSLLTTMIFAPCSARWRSNFYLTVISSPTQNTFLPNSEHYFFIIPYFSGKSTSHNLRMTTVLIAAVRIPVPGLCHQGCGVIGVMTPKVYPLALRMRMISGRALTVSSCPSEECMRMIAVCCTAAPFVWLSMLSMKS